MKDVSSNPGSASAEELAKHWRLPSVRAARELARALGVRRVKGKYPWYSIWEIEGLAPPRRRLWDELKLPHSTTADVAEALGESERSGRRRGISKPDASFPDPIPLRKKPMLWRTPQLRAWQAGLPVPLYQRASKKAPLASEAIRDHSQEPSCDAYDPFAEARSAVNGNN